MITSTNNIYKLKEREIGYLSKTGVACKAGEPYPIHIPKIMPSISSGVPAKSVEISKGPLVFKNAPTCKVLADRSLVTQNYLSIPFERNKDWGEDQASMQPDGVKLVQKRTQVTCNCKNNLTSGMTFSND